MDSPQMELETLYRLHAADLRSYLRRLTPRPGEAEDLLQETFVEAARHWKRLEAAASRRAWLFAVARNVAGRLRRRILRLRWQALPADAASPPGEEADARIEGVRDAVARLRPPFREALELRLRHDLSYAEIADVLGVPIGTVRSRIHQAVEQLREAVLETHAAGLAMEARP